MNNNRPETIPPADKANHPNSAITPLHEMPPELLQQLSVLGIEPNSIPDPGGEFVGISSAVGSSPEDQAELDKWISSGDIPEFEDEGNRQIPIAKENPR
ncbi:MAG TPA: hypothetical protein PK406_15300 [Verrucomicrobiota bacterium]|nr:hypothetical protein [Verrucomicrobiota bacterium]